MRRLRVLCYTSLARPILMCTYGGGGGEDSRRLCLGFGLPLGNDEFLCARNWIDDRRGSSCEIEPLVGNSRGLTTWRGAGDALRWRRFLGEALILAGSEWCDKCACGRASEKKDGHSELFARSLLAMRAFPVAVAIVSSSAWRGVGRKRRRRRGAQRGTQAQ